MVTLIRCSNVAAFVDLNLKRSRLSPTFLNKHISSGLVKCYLHISKTSTSSSVRFFSLKTNFDRAEPRKQELHLQDAARQIRSHTPPERLAAPQVFLQQHLESNLKILIQSHKHTFRQSLSLG